MAQDIIARMQHLNFEGARSLFEHSLKFEVLIVGA